MKKIVVAMVMCIGMLAVMSTQASAFILYSEDFEGSEDFENFRSSEWSMQGLWHVTENYAQSGTHALGFVQGETAGNTPNGNFDGYHNESAFGPSIYIPTIGSTLLSLATYYSGEGNPFDVFSIWVSLESSTSATPLGSLLATTNDGSIPGGGYNTLNFDLTSFGGQTIHLGFNFDTVDDIANNYAGARVDDILITNDKYNPGAPVPEPATMVLLGSGLFGLAGFRKRKRS